MDVFDNTSSFLKGQPTTHPAWAVQAVDALMEKVKKKGIWETIDFLVSVWMKNYPHEVEEIRTRVKDLQDTRRNKTGSSKSLAHRYLIEVPTRVNDGIDFFFLEERRKDKNFERKLWKRYPLFRVAEKL